MGQHTISLPKLHSDRSSERLKIISGLRRRGIGEHISLPQLIVCGDQSVGKSSVLEGITGFPFPRQDGLCTRFATEIILEDGPEPTNVLISIIPHSSQSQERKDEMLAFARSMTTLSDLPQVINEAGALMGLKGFAENHDGPAFGKDVLRIRISGPTGLHLSVVDLPGIIQVPSEDQQLEDVEAVHELVDSYMANPRSIILAVVQAGNDIANQPVIRKSKKFDKLGQRTIGIITKPDLINRGTEARIALLSRNEDTTKLELGFFLLKNPSPEEMAEDLDQARREALELKFFTSPPWSAQSLLQDRVGIARLRVYLQGLLDQHIDAAMPKVRNELRELQQKTREQLDRLGGERNTPTDIRIYLSRLAMSLSSLCAAALQGAYAQDRFFDRAKKDVVANRLRALIHSQNMEFATTMLSSGAKYKVKSAASSDAESDPEDHITGDGQAAVSEKRMNKWIQKIYHQTRGQELPGDYNAVFLTELFHEQSKRWHKLALGHLDQTCRSVETFLQHAVAHITDEAHTRARIQGFVTAALDARKQRAYEELDRLWRDERRAPMTYNHYYTDNIQKARDQLAQATLKAAMTAATEHDYNGKMHVSNTALELQKLLSSIQSHVNVDMDKQACSEARLALDAYYKVARKTFVDNVCRQVIERHLLGDLPDDIFSIEHVAGCSDDELRAIAGESDEKLRQRTALRGLHAALQESLQELGM